MPVEIRELQIKAVVEDRPANSSSASSPTTATNTEAIIAACIEQIMEILKQKNER
jgi:hypothetical protein